MFNETATIKWQGKEYECPITMSLIKRMERSGLNILNTRMQIEVGGVPPVSLIAELYAWLLVAGGCNVTEDEIYKSIMSDAGSQENIDLMKSAQYVTSLFFPRLESAERTTGKKRKTKT